MHPHEPDSSLVARDRYDAVLFDLDRVLASTAALHAAACKLTLDEVLVERGREPFDEEREYLADVDGKPRVAGVRDFLRARGIKLAEGRSDCPPDERSVHGIGNRKQALVAQALESGGVQAFTGSVRLVERLRRAGLRTAVVEDALAGVAARRAGGFGLMIGVARGVPPEALQAAGADVVVADVGEPV